MKNSLKFEEKRKSPRIDYAIPLDISFGGDVLNSETVNLSRAGLYCRVGVQIPLMTQLGVVFKLPGNDYDARSQLVTCAGVVVRNEGVLSDSGGKEEYEIAVFFYDIDNEEEDKIDDFIKKHIEGVRAPVQ